MSGPEKNECDHETQIANTNYRIAAAHFAKANSTVRAQAAEITRLRAEIARKDEALKPFADSCIDVSGTAAIGVSQRDIDRARAARMPAEGRAALEQEGG